MSYAVFADAVGFAARMEWPITMGGGEPTLHPMFREMADFASKELPAGYVGVITNGYDREQALRMLSLHLEGKLDARLSRDRFHAPIDPEVVRAFASHGLLTGSDEYVVRAGRAKMNGIGDVAYPDGVPICVCDEPFMPPSGELFGCGCKGVSFGKDPAAWHAGFMDFLAMEPYSCSSVSRWKRERLRRMLAACVRRADDCRSPACHGGR